MRQLIAFAALAASALPAAAAPRLLCEAAAAKAIGEPLHTLATAVFTSRVNKAEDCIFPLKHIRYPDADVLISKKSGLETHDCHGCGAVLSAYVLNRSAARPSLIASFVDISEIGSFGQTGDITDIQLGGHDAFGVTGGGTFQGYTAGNLSIFVFQNGHLDEIKPSLPLYADNSGAAVDEAKAVSVDGKWRARADTVTIDYVTKANGKAQRSSATWRLNGKAFRLISGSVPKDLAAAGGD